MSKSVDFYGNQLPINQQQMLSVLISYFLSMLNKMVGYIEQISDDKEWLSRSYQLAFIYTPLIFYLPILNPHVKFNKGLWKQLKIFFTKI